MNQTNRSRARAVAALLGLLATLVPIAFAPPAAATTEMTVTGHGYGHGRGMGQYGALGYAIDDGLSSAAILDHFYGGTSAGAVPAGQGYRVLLDGRSGLETIVYLESGWLGSSLDATLPGGAAPRKALRVVRLAADQYQLYEGNGCGGPWVDRGAYSASEVAIVNGNPNPAGLDQLLQLCEESGKRYLRGDVIATGFATSIDSNVRQRTLNRIYLEDYLRSVVPSESPSGWGGLAGGAGMNALRAQAVAARSYVAAGDGRWGTAQTCDTTFCQVYKGRGFVSAAGFTSFEATTTDQAVAETANVIRSTASGGVGRTEFSSSTGGWTAGGAFTAVVDDGDDVSSNGNHNWSATLQIATIESNFDSRAGKDLGGFIKLNVTQRNGLGVDGGRVKSVTGEFSGGSLAVTGDTFRQMFGLKSDWFVPVNPPPGSSPPPPPPPPSSGDSKTAPAGGYTMDSDGGLTPFGAAPAATGAPDLAGKARSFDVAGPSGRSGYVVGSNGALYPFSGAPARAMNRDLFPCDCAADVVVRPDGVSGWVLDTAGALWEFGGATDVTGFYSPGADFKRVAFRRNLTSGYTVDAAGVVHPFGGAPGVTSPSLASGRTVVGLMLRSDGTSGYVVDSAGAFNAFGGAPGIAAAGSTADADSRLDGTSGYVVSPGGVVAAFGGAPGVSSTGGHARIALIDQPAGYTLDGFGGLHEFGGAPRATISGYFPGNDRARRVGVLANGSGWVMDTLGQLYPFTVPGVAMPAGNPAKWGFDIARDLAVLPGGGAYLLDGYGGVHPVAGAPAVRTTFYRAGFDIARRIVVNPSGTGGFVLDGYGGFHPFAIGANPMPATPTGAYWSGWDIARGLALTGDTSGYTLDGFGGLHGFGGATGVGSWYSTSPPQAANVDGDPGRGWAIYLDSFGGIHSGPAAAPAVAPSATWPGWNIARDLALIPR